MMVAAQLGVSLNCMIEILQEMGGQEALIAEYKKRHEAVKNAMNEHCWEGDRYHRFVTDDGRVYGSKDNDQGKVFLNAVTWPILAGFADEEKAEKCIETVVRELETKCGPRICAPCYTKSDATIGGATKEAAGKKENAAIFMHPTAWYMLCLVQLGKGNMACEEISKLLPSNLAKDQNLFASDPYVHPEFVTGPDHVEFGRGGHSWLTGTAPWMHYFIGRMVGVETTLKGIKLWPCLTSEWTSFEVKRKFREDVYNIRVENPNHVECGVKSITVEGKDHPVDTPIFVGDGKEHQVIVNMG
jgi:N,N'-diacetylchitobiose phosphorylase